MRSAWTALVFTIALLCGASLAHAQKRVALVVGNSSYKHIGELANPRNDAADMAAALKQKGFFIVEGNDLGKASFIEKIREFAQASKGAEIAVFYFAGHAIQVAGQNYLAPIDTELATSVAAEVEMVATSIVYRAMEGGARFKILLLDACRDNPLVGQLKEGARSAVGRGLSREHPGQDSLISFSTQPGNTALDGDDRNSPYTAALLRHLAKSTANDDLASILQRVRGQVAASTKQKQIPWDVSSLRVPVYLAREIQPELSEAARAWELVNKRSFADIEAFADRYANTQEGERARWRIEQHWGCLMLKGHQDCVRIGGAGMGRDVRMPVPSFRDCAACPEMLIMPWGHFHIGSPDEEIGRDAGEVRVRVTVPYFFAVGRGLVRRGEWNACVAARACRTLQGTSPDLQHDSSPVLDASPDDARTYVRWLSVKTGKIYRMLSEAEWEISARAGTATAFWWGASIDSRPTGDSPNHWGFRLEAAEWVEDCWNTSLLGIPGNGSARVSGDCPRHVVRGGGSGDLPASLRSAFRSSATRDAKGIGFRVASSLSER